MKQLQITLLLAAICSYGTIQAAPVSAVKDTVNHYIIDNKPVDTFDGTQLEGKKIVSYRISTLGTSSSDPIKIHDIRTKGGAQTADPIYLIDGQQVEKKAFEALNPSGIKSITVVKNCKSKELKKYPGWENGIIMVETKTGTNQSADTKDTRVNIGYGEADSRGVSYSVSSVKPKKDEYFNNMYDYLRSKVAGIEVRSDNSIIIRGVTTLNSSTAPLILVDGVEVYDLSTLDPHDVYSVDVIKDASASIYGFKGANGVISITTKKGSERKNQ